MVRKWKDRLIDEARNWHKFWSNRLAILWGLIVTAFWNDPTALQEIVNVLPESTRALLSPMVLAIVAGLPIIVRLTKQANLTKE